MEAGLWAGCRGQASLSRCATKLTSQHPKPRECRSTLVALALGAQIDLGRDVTILNGRHFKVEYMYTRKKQYVYMYRMRDKCPDNCRACIAIGVYT